jgi:hypothetical protein
LFLRLHLTRRHTIARKMLYTIPIDWEYDYYLGNRMYRSSNENLDCGDGMNLDSYRVITITSNFGMAIITLEAITLCCLVNLLPQGSVHAV